MYERNANRQELFSLVLSNLGLGLGKKTRLFC
jgi:hypothetical protein